MPAYTQNQIRVLNSTLISKKRIEQGDLDSAEERLLAIVSAVEDYLEKYYPDQKFTILKLDDVFFQNERLLFHACAENGIRMHIVTESKAEDLSDLQITDNYCAKRMADEASRYVENILREAGAVDSKAVIRVYGNIGGRLAEAETMKELIALHNPVSIDGHVFLPQTGNEHITEDRLVRLFSGKGICGYVSFWMMDGFPDEGVQISWAKDYCKPCGICAIRIHIE